MTVNKELKPGHVNNYCVPRSEVLDVVLYLYYKAERAPRQEEVRVCVYVCVRVCVYVFVCTCVGPTLYVFVCTCVGPTL